MYDEITSRVLSKTLPNPSRRPQLPVGPQVESSKCARHINDHSIYKSIKVKKYILILKPTRCTNFSNLFLE